MNPITISIFNNKGGVGKTSVSWDLAVTLSEKGKQVLVIDFDPQCNLSIAFLGVDGFRDCLNSTHDYPYGETIRAFAQPYIQQNKETNIFIKKAKKYPKNNLDIVPGDFWLNNFADVLNVGTDVIGGAGLYRFLIISQLTKRIEDEKGKNYNYVIVDLPPSFNSLVRSALYCSDYFIVPCTADLFSAYCISLIGEMLPIFIGDWESGARRYLSTNKYDLLVPTKGKPKFGGWIFNGFDTKLNVKIGADKAQFKTILDSVKNTLIPDLNNISSYTVVENYVSENPIAEIQDLNVMAPDSIVQNIPIRHLAESRPTRDIGRGAWSQNQRDLMDNINSQYDILANYIIQNFHC